MRKRWSDRVYSAAGTIGAGAGAVFALWVWFSYFGMLGGAEIVVLLVIAGSLAATVLTALVDFVVHGWWRRPPPDPDPWDDST